jgi:DNA topoisomerase III
MGKALVIAEKPSVASDLSRALGGLEKKGDYFENEQYVISSTIGHLVELVRPGEIGKGRGKWNLQNLPIIPDPFELKPIEKTENRFKLLKRLLKREDIDRIINACDAGREGELIFRYLLQLSNVQKPIRRLWLQSMTDQAIKDAFAHLRTDEEMLPLADAAVCRSESDWLIGINATRALTALQNKAGGFQLTPAGRVQTPTLAILVEREERIRFFQPRNYWEVFADFEVARGAYRGRWFDENFKKDQDEDGRAERIWEKRKADDIRAKVLGKPGSVTEERKPTSQIAPLLYDLTSLQREANSRFGFSAKTTLQIAQQLYERLKLITYPRTDSRYLPGDYLGTSRRVLESINEPGLRTHAQTALRNGWVRPNMRIFDDAKISDHFAIIPTGQIPRQLDDRQQKIFDLVERRFIAAFFPPAQFEVTTRITRVLEEAFKTEGRILKDPGYLVVYGRQLNDGGDREIVGLMPRESARTVGVEVQENQTKPPPRYQEGTLLSAMEGAGKLVEDEDLRDAMSEKGLGTPATRAQIIEGLIQDGYVFREGRDLVVSAKGLSLLTLLGAIGIDALRSPALTGDWEYRLNQMEHGRLQRALFMNDIRAMTRAIVANVQSFANENLSIDNIAGKYVTLDVRCPNCGAANLKENYRTYYCENCGYRFFKNVASRELSAEEVTALFREGKIGPLEGFRSRLGRPFSAVVVLNEEHKPALEFEKNGDSQTVPVDPNVHARIGPCQVCQKGDVFDVGTAYVCENLASGACTFKLAKRILGREISPDDMRNMLVNGRSNLLKGFISKKNKRSFDAALTLKRGEMKFEFPERRRTKAKGKSRRGQI